MQCFLGVYFVLRIVRVLFPFLAASGALFVWKAGSAKANVKKCVLSFACITDGLHAKCPKYWR